MSIELHPLVDSGVSLVEVLHQVQSVNLLEKNVQSLESLLALVHLFKNIIHKIKVL